MIDAALYTLVTGNAGVFALIGTRMYPDRLDQGTVFPAISYQQISEHREDTLGAPATTPDVLFQFDCWDVTRTGSRTLARAVRLAMDNVRPGLVGGETIQVIRLINQTGQYEPAVKLYRVLQEYRVSWNES